MNKILTVKEKVNQAIEVSGPPLYNLLNKVGGIKIKCQNEVGNKDINEHYSPGDECSTQLNWINPITWLGLIVIVVLCLFIVLLSVTETLVDTSSETYQEAKGGVLDKRKFILK